MVCSTSDSVLDSERVDARKESQAKVSKETAVSRLMKGNSEGSDRERTGLLHSLEGQERGVEDEREGGEVEGEVLDLGEREEGVDSRGILREA